MNKRRSVFYYTLQVRSFLSVLWNQLEHQWIWFKYAPHTLHLRCHWSPRQADDLLLSQHHWTKEVPSRHAVTDWHLHRHKHLFTTRLLFSFTFYRNYMKTRTHGLNSVWYYELVWAETSASVLFLCQANWHVLLHVLCLVFVGLWHMRAVVAILGKGLSEASFTAVFLYTTELYPTVVRSDTVA